MLNMRLVMLCICLALPALALSQDVVPVDPPVADGDPDVGLLQAELARVEAERQQLADQLAAGTDNQLLERLQAENRELRIRHTQAEMNSRTDLEAQRQKWFVIGGGTVFVSLILGFVLANLGGKRKRSEWLN